MGQRSRVEVVRISFITVLVAVLLAALPSLAAYGAPTTSNPISIPWRFPGPASLDSPEAPMTTTAPCPQQISSPCLYALGGVADSPPGQIGDNILSTAYSYDPVKNNWVAAHSLPVGTMHAGVATAPCGPSDPKHDCIYLLGGFTTEGSTTNIDRYDPTSNRWKTVGQLNQKVENLQAASAPCYTDLSKTCVYAIGGILLGTHGFDSVEMFDPSSGSTTEATPIQVYSKGGRRFVHHFISDGSATTAPCRSHLDAQCIYLTGGVEDRVPQSTVLMYDPSLDNGSGTSKPGPWSQVSVLPAPVANATAFSAHCPRGSGHCLTVLGGWNEDGANGGFQELSAAESYNLSENTWVHLPALNLARYGGGGGGVQCGASASATCFFAVGGFSTGKETTATMERLGPNAKNWQLSATLDPGRDLQGVVATQCAPPPARGVRPAAKSPGTCIYSIGGFAVDDATKTEALSPQVYMYAAASGHWTEISATPHPVAAAGDTTGPCPKDGTESCIYVLGGFASNGKTTAKASVFHTKTGAWSSIKRLPSARALLGAASAPCRSALTRRCIYAIGGTTDATKSNSETSTTFMYDPTRNTWTKVAPADFKDEGVNATSGPCVSSPRICLYLAPGVNAQTMDMYDPQANQWLELATSATFSAAITDGPCSNDPSRSCIWLMGGLRRNKLMTLPQRTVQEFDPQTDNGGGSNLIELAPLLRTRTGAGAASGPCFGNTALKCVYTVGGSPNPDASAGGGWSEAIEMAQPVEFRGRTFRVGKVSVNRNNGTGKVVVNLNGGGGLSMDGNSVRGVFELVGRAGTRTLTIRAKGAAAATLKKKGRVTVRPKIQFLSTAQPGHVTRLTVTLRR